VSRKREVEQAEAYALRQMRALILNALDADVEGSFEHEDGTDEFLIDHDAPNVRHVQLRVRVEVVR
jgi:hypothetical protein